LGGTIGVALGWMGAGLVEVGFAKVGVDKRGVSSARGMGAQAINVTKKRSKAKLIEVFFIIYLQIQND